MSDLVPADPRQPQPEPDLEPGYYRCRGEVRDVAADELVYLLGVEDGRAKYVRGDRQWSMAAVDFAGAFRFEPDGLAQRQAEIAELMSEASELQAESQRSSAALRAYNPHVGASGDLTGTELATTGPTPLDAKRAIAEVRNSAAKLRNELEARTAAIKAFTEEQAIILRAQAAELAAMVSVAEEKLWTINLYLGTDEEIVTLATGQPAAAEEPITVRQLVLYMDEECAVAAESGGIDARSIEEFDAWLTADPAHLAQVLPETKGMVALKPRRNPRDYGDPWVNRALNEANAKTYFLLRNGDNLYRMWTSLEVGERLIPRSDEFVRFFVERTYNFSTRRYEEERLEPGSSAFMKASKTAEGAKRHYMRVALVLQGLIDRTTIFRPLAWDTVSVIDQAAYEPGGPLHVILDADAMLSDGRERFTVWFRRINTELTVGMRVVGCFNSWEHGLRNYDAERSWGHRNERISPNGAGYPSSEGLYTLEGKRDGGFVFYFARNGERYDPYAGYVPFQKRASCLIYPSDQFILNFDAATIEEMEYYLASRLDRHAYTYLFPTLKLALRLKAEEAAAEAPFRLLLIGEIVKAHAADPAEVEARIDELISWWKFANRTHRALSSDDAKALRMISAEYGRRIEQERVRDARSSEAQAMLESILAVEPTALLVAHKAGAEYVALVPANDENIFVHEQTWTVRGRKAIKQWRVVDKRHERWQILHSSTRWADWKIGASRAEHLTDAERMDLVETAFARLRTDRKYRGQEPKARDTEALAAAVRSDGRLEVYFRDGRQPLPTENLLSNPVREPDLGYATISWKRDHRRAPVLTSLRESHIVYGRGWPWEVRYDGERYAGKVLVTYPEAIAAFAADVAAHERVRDEADRLRDIATAAFIAYERSYLARIEDAARAKFAADFGDPTLWEGHRKTLKLPTNLRADGLREAIRLLVERDVDMTGLSAGAVVERARALSGTKLDIADEHADLLPTPTDDGVRHHD